MTHLELFLSNPAHPGKSLHITTTLVRGLLLFKLTYLTWNEDRQENDEQNTMPMDAKAFGGWYQAQQAQGWIIQD